MTRADRLYADVWVLCLVLAAGAGNRARVDQLLATGRDHELSADLAATLANYAAEVTRLHLGDDWRAVLSATLNAYEIRAMGEGS